VSLRIARLDPMTPCVTWPAGKCDVSMVVFERGCRHARRVGYTWSSGVQECKRREEIDRPRERSGWHL